MCTCLLTAETFLCCAIPGVFLDNSSIFNYTVYYISFMHVEQLNPQII